LQQFLILLIGGLVTGALYSRIASGLALVCSATGIFNFSCGAVAYVCGYLFYLLDSGGGWNALAEAAFVNAAGLTTGLRGAHFGWPFLPAMLVGVLGGSVVARVPDRLARDRVFDRFPVLRERRRVATGNLSGGKQQILTRASFMANPPKVRIADEPTAAYFGLSASETPQASPVPAGS
jgi:hypothetical protein